MIVFAFARVTVSKTFTSAVPIVTSDVLIASIEVMFANVSEIEVKVTWLVVNSLTVFALARVAVSVTVKDAICIITSESGNELIDERLLRVSAIEVKVTWPVV